MLFQPPPDAPIIVNLAPIEQTNDLQGLADVLFGSLGLTGVIVIGAILFGIVVAAFIFAKHELDRRASERSEGSEGLRF